MVVIAMVKLDIREGTDSGIITLQMICIGVAPILSAASIIFGFTSLREDSTSLDTKGKAAITRGIMEGAVPTTVPMISLVRGITRIIRIRKGTERSRLIITLRKCIKGAGRGLIPPFSPVTRRTPRGSPMTIEKKVERIVT